jgi:intracellular multiplication protein IcmJ
MTAKSRTPIILSAKRKSWRMMDEHAGEADKRYVAVRDQVLARDDYTCSFCGFRASKWQEVHHVDDDHSNNKLSNLKTACCLCHQCFHLGFAGVRRAGTIIWLPEIDQADLNNVVRAIFVAISTGRQQEQGARSLYEALESRAGLVEQALGQGASNPAAIGQAFLEMTDEQYASRNERLGGLRLLARMQAFGKQIAYWQSDRAAFGAFSDADWPTIFTSHTDAGLADYDGDADGDVGDGHDGGETDHGDRRLA